MLLLIPALPIFNQDLSAHGAAPMISYFRFPRSNRRACGGSFLAETANHLLHVGYHLFFSQYRCEVGALFQWNPPEAVLFVPFSIGSLIRGLTY